MPGKAKQSTTATKDAPAKTASAKDAPAKKVNPALMKPLQPSKELAAVVGSKPLPRPEVVSKVWDYIKKHKLQDPQNKREIMADEKLQAVFGKERVTMFEMNKHLAQHLK
jgi:upstream activation factor subunit UAF30